VLRPTGIGVRDEDVTRLQLAGAARIRAMSVSGSPPTFNWNFR
jgi:hypothetical protein